ncbi:hypothetical protein U1Q18_052754 [Sarracenia purpurea var. burkii]
MLLAELFITPPTLILCYDNVSVISLTSNPVFHACSKHIEIDYYFVREKVASKCIRVQYVPTTDNVADILTRPLSSSRFHTLRAKLMVRSTPISLKGNDKTISKFVQTQSTVD